MEDGGLGTSEESDQRDLRQLGGETLVLWRTAASAHLLFMVAEREVPGIETVSLSFNNFNLEFTLLLEPLSRGPSSKEDAGADRGRENVPIKEEVHRLENRMLSQDLSCCRRKGSLF